jgi:HAD superfamily hydrolase (TIGR01509 family)
MIKAIFWDNDGVLVDTERLYFESTRQVLASVGIILTQQLFIELFLVKAQGAWHLAKVNGLSENQIEQLRNERNALYSKMLSSERLILPNVSDVISTLYGRYKMFVVTSSRKEHFDVIHRSTGLLKYFDFIFTGEDYEKHKPDPEPYLVAIKRSGFRKEECLAIEDSERGLVSAKGAGLLCYVIPTALTQGSNFSLADKVLQNIKDVELELS